MWNSPKGFLRLFLFKRPLSGDFDPEAHEKLMSEVLKNYGEGEEEFDEDGEIVKPEFSDMEEWEEEIKAEKKKKKVSNLGKNISFLIMKKFW